MGLEFFSKFFSADKQGLSYGYFLREIIFENISFSYASGTNIINDLNLKICHGERVGLVGPQAVERQQS